MMRDLIIKAAVSEKEAARFDGRMAMVVPLSDEEAAVLYADVNSVDDFLTRAPLALSTLLGRLRTSHALDPEAEAMLEALISRATASMEYHDRLRRRIGGAIFVGTERKGTIQ